MTDTGTEKLHDRDARASGMRDKILAAALKLFVEHTYAKVTIRKIASAIGYSPGNIYYYFQNKAAIFAELRNHGFALLYQAQQQARQSDDARQRLYAHTQAYARFALVHREYYELMFLLDAPIDRPSDKNTATASGACFDLLIEDVQLAIDHGVLPPARSTRRVALLLLSTLHGLVSLILRGRVVVDSLPAVQDVAAQTIDILFEYTRIMDVDVDRYMRKNNVSNSANGSESSSTDR
jgi:AcrR family transcriptional regulator